MKQVRLEDGTEVFCLQRMEAKVLDSHVDGYLQNGIEVRRGETVMDVGANIGLFGIRVVQRFSESRVYAFEPTPPIHQILEANAGKHGSDRLTALNLALGEEEGTLDLTYYPNSPALSTAHPEQWEGREEMLEEAVKGTAESAPGLLRWARFLPFFVHKWIAARMRAQGEHFSCSVSTVSRVIEEHEIDEIGLLKVDCEGAEWAVLQGVEKKDWAKIRQVVVEVHDHDGRLEQVCALLSEHGLTNQTVDQESGLEKTALYNVFAIRP